MILEIWTEFISQKIFLKKHQLNAYINEKKVHAKISIK